MSKTCDFAHVLGYGRATQPVAKQDPPVHADAALLALGGRLEKLWIAEQAAFARSAAEDSDEAGDLAEVACGASSAVVEQIEAMSATTFAGVKVKARAFAWCRSDVPVTVEELFGPDTTTDIRLLVGLVRDLLQLKDEASSVTGAEAGLRQREDET